MNTQIKLKIKTIIKTKKTIHLDEWGIDQYLKIFHIPKYIKKGTIKWFLSLIDKEKTVENDNIKILCPGIGAGRNELGFIIALANKFESKNIKCDFVDYSDASCMALKNNLKKFNFKENDSSGIYLKKNLKVSILEVDYEDWLKTNRQQYNIILAFFIINFLSDWRQSLLKTINLLCSNGLFVVSQDIGDLCYLDNYFDRIEKNGDVLYSKVFYDFWKEYYELRHEYGLDWNNIISPSNMKFVLDVFKDIHNITNAKIEDNEREFIWQLNDLQEELNVHDIKELKTFNFWLDLIKGTAGDKSDEVFNCLCIENYAREKIFEMLSIKYSGCELPDLVLGEKLFYLKRDKSIDNFHTICKYVIYNKCFNISTITGYKFLNRTDIQNGDNIKEHLLNRALDVYNCYIHNKEKAMVSLFSKEIDYRGGNLHEHWRYQDTPKIVPLSFTNEQKQTFIKSYGLYFALSKYIKNRFGIQRLLTGLLHTELPEKIGIIITITDCTKESVTPILYNNSKKLKAIRINLIREKCEKGINIINENLNFSNFRVAEDKIPISNYFFIDLTIEVRDQFQEIYGVEYNNKSNELDKMINGFEALNITDGEKVSEKIVNLISQYMDVDNFEIDLEKRFSLIYLILLSHRVDCNIIVYTSTNIYFGQTIEDENEKEQGFYGLILADHLPYINENKFVESYYDQMVSNTFLYSGMDGIYENSKKIEIITRDAEWKLMFDEIPHTVNSEVNAIQMRLNEISRICDQNTEVKEHLKTVDNYMQYWCKSNEILRLLARDEKIADEYRDVTIKFQYWIGQCLKTIRDSLEVLRINFETVEKLRGKLNNNRILKSLIENVQQPSIDVVLNVDIVFILFLDILKNSLRYCDPSRENFIQIYSSEECEDQNLVFYCLHFINNLPLGGAPALLQQNINQKLETRKQIKNLIEGDPVNYDHLFFSKSGRVGYRVIRKILNYLKWDIKVNNGIEDDTETEIIIRIPLNGDKNVKKNKNT